MQTSSEKYKHFQFEGVRPPTAAELPVRRNRGLEQVPPPSIFGTSYQSHAPVISPADRLLLDDVFRRLQLNRNAYRPTALGRRVPACLRALQARSPAEAMRRLEQEPAAVELAINALMIGVTAFFRDERVFAHLQQVLLPDLLRHTPAPRILSVGCSDGAEVYSLAMCLREAGAKTFEIRGIDCRRRAIQRAKTGTFPGSSLSNISADLLHKYFDNSKHTYSVKPFLKADVHWQVGDAFIHLPAAPYDLIACRNFVIYLEHPAAARLWRRLHAALRPGGWLLTGKAERPASGFLRVGPCLYRKADP